MDLISLVITIILGLMGLAIKRLYFICQTILVFVCGFVLSTIFYPKAQLWGFGEYLKPENYDYFFSQSNRDFFKTEFFCSLFSFISIHILVRQLIIRRVEKYEPMIESILASEGLYLLENWLRKRAGKYMLLYYKLVFFFRKPFNKVDNFSYEISYNWFNHFFCRCISISIEVSIFILCVYHLSLFWELPFILFLTVFVLWFSKSIPILLVSKRIYSDMSIDKWNEKSK